MQETSFPCGNGCILIIPLNDLSPYYVSVHGVNRCIAALMRSEINDFVTHSQYCDK